ncbi:LA_2272 family surface repeat-containing protein [Endomicrobium proavitum]|uniref:Uncharacterized protein n=1 Tax=Endomicrobium proavitum TaxID=1408281 RepID=A0A0G3WK62_9BACT|nr:hypothetical protein [Endomicrobium proavitum]AKL98285.1 conserved exported protein of unknown function [Endomicrobium proavitum]
MKKKLMSAVCLVLLLSSVSFAATPFKLSLLGPITVPANQDVTGLAIGLIGSNVNTLQGVQLSWIYNVAENGAGVQASGIYNKVAGEFTGVQYAVVNIAGSVKGLQFGFYNQVRSMAGVQIGLININPKSSFLAFFPFINFQF